MAVRRIKKETGLKYDFRFPDRYSLKSIPGFVISNLSVFQNGASKEKSPEARSEKVSLKVMVCTEVLWPQLEQYDPSVWVSQFLQYVLVSSKAITSLYDLRSVLQKLPNHCSSSLRSPFLRCKNGIRLQPNHPYYPGFWVIL